MALFNRRKNQTITELESYYAGKKNQNVKAWVMAFLSLLVTVAVIAALFFGGRWIYRSLTNDSDEKSTTSQESNEQTTDTTNGGGSLTISDADSSNNESDASNASEDFPEVVTDEAASTTVPSTSRTTAPNNTTASDNLPNTGAGEILIIAPILAFVSGIYLSRKYQLK